MRNKPIYRQLEQAIPFNSTMKLIIVPLLILILIVLLVQPIISIGVSVLFTGSIKETLSNLGTLLTSAPNVVGECLTVLVTIAIILKISKIRLKDIGLHFKGAFPAILKGILLGFATISLVGLSITLLGGVEITYNFKPEYMGTILLGVIFFAFQGTFEELVFRSYLMPHFSKKIGLVLSIIFTSICFTLLHATNPGMELMPVVNLFIFSIVFSLVYYYTSSLWIVGFAHAMWNFSQGFIYGSMVSGITLNETILKSTPIKGEDIISGKTFGFEGSIVTTAVGILAILILIVMIRKQNLKIEY